MAHTDAVSRSARSSTEEPDSPQDNEATSVDHTVLSPGGIPIRFRTDLTGFLDRTGLASSRQLGLHLTLARLQLLRGFDELLCLDGLNGVEHLPHQIETVRKVMRRFRGRVLLADEVGLGKTIEACLLLREYLLRRLVKRVLILVPNPLVSQWQQELSGKFHLDFTIPPKTVSSSREEFWKATDRVLVSTSSARSGQRAGMIASVPWDLVIVDEAHHCKNRSTKLWQLVNSLSRRHMFLLTATPVQNNLVELYNLLTLLEPGHLKTEADFKKRFVTRGNPRDPRNRQKLRELLGEVMIRNTRSLVQINLPPRYAQTIVAEPGEIERQLRADLESYLRDLMSAAPSAAGCGTTDDDVDESNNDETGNEESGCDSTGSDAVGSDDGMSGEPCSTADPDHVSGCVAESTAASETTSPALPTNPTSATVPTPVTAMSTPAVSRMRLQSLLQSLGSHPAAVAGALESLAQTDARAASLRNRAEEISRSAKDDRLLGLLRDSQGHKVLVFVNALKTLHRLQQMLTDEAIAFSTFSGEQSAAEKDAAVERLRTDVPVMLCTDSGGEGRNLQFADTLVNYDLPWNPMWIEQRIGRVHRFGQTQDVFIFNLCTAGSLESRILSLLSDKIRMFELVVGEVGSILGNLDEGDEFESLVLKLWIRAGNDQHLDREFDALGNTLLDAQEKYLDARNLDEALFGEDFE